MAEPDYGRALSCVSDVSRESRTVTGHMVVAEALARRLGCPRGRLIGYPNYGYDLCQFVNADLNKRDLAAIRAGVEAECLKDERVEGASADVVLATDGTLTVTIEVVGAKGPFTLVLGVSSVTVEILKVAA